MQMLAAICCGQPENGGKQRKGVFCFASLNEVDQWFSKFTNKDVYNIYCLIPFKACVEHTK